jgi:phage-related protein
MKKQYMAVRQVRDFIAAQPEACQAEYLAIVERLEHDGFLVEPYAKKIDKELFEIRIRRGRQVRIFYCYHDRDLVIGVHGFLKKSQKAPLREVRQARRVAADFARG